MSKPFVPEILISKVRVFLDLYRQRQALEDAVKQLNATNAQLERVNNELQTLSYAVSHDLRAPLRAVDGYSRVLLEALGETLHPQALHYLETIRNQTHEMNTLLDGLLEFSRLAFQPLAPRPMEMKDLAQYALDALLSAEREKGRAVQVTLADLPSAWGDPAVIKKVWEILVSNALKFTRPRERAEIEIGATQNGGQIIYFVRDNGVGFDMQYAATLFGIFQRMHAPDEFEGAGVGLANLHRVVVRHGGKAWAESELEKGTTIFFSLPAHNPHLE
jgi:light-regulated signal transduction histidine kinase (bacteriophytochrome)